MRIWQSSISYAIAMYKKYTSKITLIEIFDYKSLTWVKDPQCAVHLAAEISETAEYTQHSQRSTYALPLEQ